MKAGEQTLVLVVTARVKISGFPDEHKDLQSIERRIRVRVNPADSIKNFIYENLEWILTVIVVPLVAAGVNWLRKKYAARKNAKTQSKNVSR